MKMEATCEAADAMVDPYVLESWNTLKSDIDNAASEVLGRGRRRQPDWFVESQAALEPLLEVKQRAHQRMLCEDNPVTCRRFRASQREVAKAVRAAKGKWVCNVAQEAEKAARDRCVRWKCIEKLQVLDRSRRPKTMSSVRNREGQLVDNLAELKACCHDHFNRILNIPSSFDPVVLDTIPVCEPRSELDGGHSYF